MIKILDLKTSLLDSNINIKSYEKYSNKLYTLNEELIELIRKIYLDKEVDYLSNLNRINNIFLDIKKNSVALRKIISDASIKNSSAI